MQLYNLVEHWTNGYELGYVSVVSLLAIGLGVLIIIAKNPVISILFLIGLFVNISMYLMLSGLFFMGLAYLLVYVGAVSILFIFILMLINVRVSELSTEEKNSIPLAILAVVSFNYIVTPGLPYSVYISELLPLHVLHIWNRVTSVLSHNLFGGNNTLSKYKEKVTDSIASVHSNAWDSSLTEVNHITSIGNVLYTNLFILLIITSLILLLAMVGTIVITVKKDNKSYLQ